MFGKVELGRTKGTGSARKPVFLALLMPFLLQTPEPLFGTWILKYTTGPSAYSRVSCRIEPWQDGLRVIYDMVGNRGGVTHWEWTGKLDGKDYPLEGVEENIVDAYSRIDDHTYRVVLKVDGKTATITTITVSPDGKTMTVASSSSNSAFYTRR
jgi:hypothetical protein